MSDEAGARWRLVGVGCDTEARGRLAKVLERRPTFLQRWYTPLEQGAVSSADDPLDMALRLFCLKEAAIKAAWPLVKLGPRSVEGRLSPAGIQLQVPTKMSLNLRLEAECFSDPTHAWAQVLCWKMDEARELESRPVTLLP
jgi:hypothetical protein